MSLENYVTGLMKNPSPDLKGRLMLSLLDKLEKLSCKKLKEYLDFSNRFCGLSVQKHGAIDSYPTLPEMGL